jgi:hypothetical protein
MPWSVRRPMGTISLFDARSLGLPTYSGPQCRQLGHGCERRVRDHRCIVCVGETRKPRVPSIKHEHTCRDVEAAGSCRACEAERRSNYLKRYRQSGRGKT